MVFAPTNNPNDTSDQTVTNLAFFPNILVAAFRTAVRLQDTVTDERVVKALTTAMMDVNRELADWKAAQILLGYNTLAEVASQNYGAITELQHYYMNAVYSKAKAELVEFYNDSDTTSEGLRRFIGFLPAGEAYLREAKEAIRNILGDPHMTVELI